MGPKPKRVVKQRKNNGKKLAGGVTGKGFVKGDPRINRKGRPRSFNQLRAVLLDFLAEPSGRNSTRLYTLLERMSLNKTERKTLLEYAFGKVPVAVDVTTRGESLNQGNDDIRAEILRKLDRIAASQGESGDDQQAE